MPQMFHKQAVRTQRPDRLHAQPEVCTTNLLATAGRLFTDVTIQQAQLVLEHTAHQFTEIATRAFVGVHHISDIRVIEQIVVAGFRKTCGALGEDILVAIE